MKNFKQLIEESAKTLTDKVLTKSKEKDGNFFVVTKRDTSGMKGSQDAYSMYLVDKNMKIAKDYGSHASLEGAQSKFAKSRGYEF